MLNEKSQDMTELFTFCIISKFNCLFSFYIEVIIKTHVHVKTVQIKFTKNAYRIGKCVFG